jgi:hypothetical protein
VENIVLDTLDVISDVKEVVVERVSEVHEVLTEVIEEEILPVRPREEALPEDLQKLSALALAIIVFYKVSGGPFGCEPTIRAAGPLLLIAGICHLPIALVLAGNTCHRRVGSSIP